MACGFEKELLSALLDGELSDREQARVRSHVDLCAECRKEFSDVQSTSSMLHQAGPAKAPAGILKAIEREIHREPPVQEGFFARYRRALHGAMALAGAVLIVLTIVAVTGKSPVQQEQAMNAPSAKPAPMTKMPSRERFADDSLADSKALKEEENRAKATLELAKKQEPKNEPAPVEPPIVKDMEKKKDEAQELAKRSETPPLPPAKPAADPTPSEAPADEAKPQAGEQDKAGRDLAKEEKMPAPDPSADAPPTEKSAEGGRKLGKVVEPQEVTIILYADRLSDARDAVNKELSKLSGKGTSKEAVITATLSSTNSAKLTKALKSNKSLEVVEVPSVKASALPDLAERSKASWEETMGFAKNKENRTGEAKKAPNAEAQAPNGPVPFNAQQGERPRGAPAPGAATPPAAAPQSPAGGKGMQVPEPPPAPAPAPKIDTGVMSQPEITVRIYLMPKSYAATMNEELRRIEAPTRAVDKK